MINFYLETTQLQNIIQQGGGIRIEFNEAYVAVPASLYETVVSFSNTDAGKFLLGVDDIKTLQRRQE